MIVLHAISEFLRKIPERKRERERKSGIELEPSCTPVAQR